MATHLTLNHRIPHPKHLLGVLGVVLLLSGWTPAQATLTIADNSQQRKNFQEAERALKRGQLTHYKRLKQKLRGYPLYPYLRFQELRRKLSKATPEEIQTFLIIYPDTPLATRLKYAWLKTLARQRNWQLLVDNYSPSDNLALQCDYAHALYEVDEEENAFTLTERLWRRGEPLPKDCDRPIKVWREGGQLSQELVWERIHLAMQAGHSRLARFLAKYLDKKDRFWVSLWAKVRRHPDFLLKAHDRFTTQHPPVLRWIVADGLSRLALKDEAKAVRYWQELHRQYAFTPKEKERIEGRLILSLLKTGTAESKTWLKRLKFTLQNSKVVTGHILSALQDQDWASALQWMDRLSNAEKHSERWRYWRGRALEGQGHLEEARSVYLLNTDERSYYGFLAADHTGNGYQIIHRPLSYSGEDLIELSYIPAILRAKELYALKRVVDARREWRYATQRMTKAQLPVAAKLAQQWGWHDRAIMTLAQAKHWDDLELRFPLAHKKIILGQAKRQGINPAWAYAIIRQESAFTSDARSHAGAMGLMQLLPRTARQVARSLRMRRPRRNDLLNVTTNVRLGIRYLKKVQDRFNGHPVLATAAYNAGLLRVKTWLPQINPIPADLWIETVPFAETRNYLKRVLTYTVIYEQRLGKQPVPLLERMLPIPSTATRLSRKINAKQGEGT